MDCPGPLGYNPTKNSEVRKDGLKQIKTNELFLGIYDELPGKTKIMNATKIITAICSLLFFMIGADKFFSFLEPPCSLMSNIPTTLWKILGVLQLAAGILIWLPKYRKYVAGFFFVFMLFFTIIHIVENTYDIGGAVLMAVLLGLLVWDPAFLKGKKT